jgi:thioredoxin 1
MAGNLVELNEDNFDETVVKADKLSMVDFWAEWCGPCKLIAPAVEELADEYEGKVNVGKLNVDDYNKTAMQFGIRSIPTLLFFKDGVIAKQVVGVKSKAELKEIIDENL